MYDIKLQIIHKLIAINYSQINFVFINMSSEKKEKMDKILIKHNLYTKYYNVINS